MYQLLDQIRDRLGSSGMEMVSGITPSRKTSIYSDSKIMGSVPIAVANKKTYTNSGNPTENQSSLDYEESTKEWRLNFGYTLEEQESLFSTAFLTHWVKIHNAGFGLKSNNQKALEYVNTSLREISARSPFPLSHQVSCMAMDLIRCSNAMAIKIRGQRIMSPGKRIVYSDGRARDPIIGLDVIDPSRMTPVVNKSTGRLVAWDYDPPTPRSGGGLSIFTPLNKTQRRYALENVFHAHFNRVHNHAFGKPWYMSAVSDVEELRAQEGVVSAANRQNIFGHPVLRVGVDRQGNRQVTILDENGVSPEIEAAKNLLELAPPDSTLVVPGDWVLEDKARNVDVSQAIKLIDHLTSRAQMGLHLNSINTGDGSTANRATAVELTGEGIAFCKAFATILSTFITEQIIFEILWAGGYNPIDPKQSVEFLFREIDVKSKMDFENHSMLLYQGNLITRSEARHDIQREPRVDDKDTYLNLVQIPLKKVGGTDSLDDQESNYTRSKEIPSNQHTSLVRKSTARKT